MADTLTITDNRTGQTYEVGITDDTIQALALRDIKVEEDDFGMMSYDPGFKNTAACESSITYLDGERGILEYRGYPIEDLAERSTHLESAYLLINGRLPNRHELEEWTGEIMSRSMLHEKAKNLMGGFRADAHPMGVLVSSIAAMSTFYPEAKEVNDEAVRMRQICRIIAKLPTIAAYSLRHRLGWPYVYPNTSLGYTGNFFHMLLKKPEQSYEPNPVFEKALDLIFLLHADHEQNCSTTAMRTIGSSLADPYSATAGACAALYGPLHGGANERVLGQLQRIGSKDKIPALIERVKQGEERLMGFGHRVYRNYDPRARIIKKMADEVLDQSADTPLMELAKELERIALEDDYFVERKLYPNVDFYSGIILHAMNFPADEFTVLFAIARSVGWLAQWHEMMSKPVLARPRQIYRGGRERRYVSIDER